MLASIDPQQDIEIFLEEGEDKTLENGIVTGTIISLDKPKKQNRISVQKDDNRSNGFGKVSTGPAFGIGVHSVNENYEIFVSSHYSGKLLADGSLGTRYGTQGRKVDMLYVPRASHHEKTRFEHLKFYLDNRDKLPENFG